MNQYALLGHGKTIHASGQLEASPSQLANDKQRILTPDGYNIALDIIQGLPCIKLRSPTDIELTTLPHIILTSDSDWDPTILSNISTSDLTNDLDNVGYSLNEVSILMDCKYIVGSVANIQVNNDNINYQYYQPQLGWIPVDIIKLTFQHTTQYARSLHL
jgi:hypothetical protein